MLFVPLGTGLAVGVAHGGRILPGFLLAGAAFFLFCLRTPVESLLGTQALRPTPSERSHVWRYAVGFSAASTLMLVTLLAKGHLLLLAFGAAAAIFFVGQTLARKRKAWRTASQIIGAAGLAITSPAAYYVATGGIAATAALLWLANWLFAANQVHYVHLRIDGAKLTHFADKFERGRTFLAAQITTVTLVAMLSLSHMAPAALPLVFLPALFRGTWWFISPEEPLRVKRLGLTEVAQALVFGILLVVAFATL